MKEKAGSGPVSCMNCKRTFERAALVQVKTSGRGGNYYLCQPCNAMRKPPTFLPDPAKRS